MVGKEKAKEKAKELVNRFSKLDKGLNEKEWKGKDVSFEEFHKQCALICVNEILKTFIHIDPGLKYWKEVKKEIKKL